MYVVIVGFLNTLVYMYNTCILYRQGSGQDCKESTDLQEVSIKVLGHIGTSLICSKNVFKPFYIIYE